MKEISRSFFIILIIFVAITNTFPQTYKVVESNTEHIVIEFNFSNSYNVVDTVVSGRIFQKIRGEDHSYRNPGEPWLPEFMVLVGIPFDSKPTFRVMDQKQTSEKNRFLVLLS